MYEIYEMKYLKCIYEMMKRYMKTKYKILLQ